MPRFSSFFQPWCYMQFDTGPSCICVILKCSWVVLNADISNKKLWFIYFFAHSSLQPCTHILFPAPYVDGLQQSPHSNVNKSESREQSGLCAHLLKWKIHLNAVTCKHSGILIEWDVGKRTRKVKCTLNVQLISILSIYRCYFTKEV